jgi:hypothetical protein
LAFPALKKQTIAHLWHADVGCGRRQGGAAIDGLFGMVCQVLRCLRKNYFV